MSNKSSRFSGFGGNRGDDDDEEERSTSRSSSPFGRSSSPGKPDDKKQTGTFSNRSSSFGRRTDDDEDDEEEEERNDRFGSRSGSSSFGKGSSSFGRRNNDDDDNEEDYKDEDDEEEEERPTARPSQFGSKPGGSFGSKEPAKPVSSVFGGSKNEPAKPGASPAKPSPFGSKPAEPAKPSPFGSKTAEPAKPSPFGSKPGSSIGNKPGEPAKSTSSVFGGSKNEPAKPGTAPAKPSPFGSKPAEPAKPSPFGSKTAEPAKPSPFGSKPGESTAKPGGSAFGAKKEEPKKEEEAKSGSGIFGKLPFGGKKEEEKPAPAKPGSSASPAKPSPFGSKPAEPAKPSPFGSKTAEPAKPSPFGSKPGESTAKPGSSPFGAKPADKKDEAKPGSSFGGFGSKPSTASKPGDKTATGVKPAVGTPAKPAAATKEEPKSGGGLFGKLPFGGKKDDEKKDDKSSAAKPGSSATPAKPSPFGAKTPEPAKPATGATGKTATTTAKPVGTSKAIATAKEAPKVPPARGDKAAKPLDKGTRVTVKAQGLSLDQKLDIVGYALMFAALVALFGIIQPSEGSLTYALAKLLGQLFGNGKFIWPIVLMGVGLWLLVRRFKVNPFLVIDYQRVIGGTLLYVTLTTVLHWFALLNIRVAPGDWNSLYNASQSIVLNMQGGGWVGSQIYYLLVRITGLGTLSDISIPVILLGLLIISSVLTFNITTGEVTTYIRSVFSWFARVRRSYLDHRQAAMQARAEANAAKTALKLQTPAAAGALATAAAGAGPAPAVAAPPARAGIPEKTGSAPAVAGPPRLTPASPPSTPKPSANPFGKAPGAGGEKAEAVAEAAPAQAEKKGLFGKAPSQPAPAGSPAKPGLFGSKPAPAETDEEADEELDEVKDVAPIVKPSPLGAKPAGADGDNKPASGPTINRPAPLGAKPASSPFASKPAPAEVAEEADAKPATPVAAAPAVNRPNPFAPKPGSSPFAKPTEKNVDEDEGDEEEGANSPKVAQANEPASKPAPLTGAPSAKPADGNAPAQSDKPATSAAPAASAAPASAAPAANRPNPFAPKPGGSPFAKPADNKPDQADDEDEPPAKPATPIGNRFNPFAPKSASSTPAAKPAEGNKPAEATKTLDTPAPQAEPEKPATPKGTSPFGAGPMAAKPAFTPVPKPGLATRPPLEHEEEDEDKAADPKYVDLDEEDQARPHNGPRPTVSGSLNAEPATMPPPANPVMARPRPGADAATQPISRPPTSPFGPRPPAPTSVPGADAAKDDKQGDTAKTEAKISEETPTAAATVAMKPVSQDTAASKPAPSPAPSAPAKPVESSAPAAKPPEGVMVRSKEPQNWPLPNYQEILQAGSQQHINDEILMDKARVIEDTLKAFDSPGKVVEINPGPVITQFGVEPDYLVSRQGKKTRVKVGAIARLDADLALALAARSIRIEAPVPGKGYVGIEVPNDQTALVSLRDIMESEAFQKINSKLRIGLGQSVDGAPITADLTQMPHLLIAGTTGSGKSVCVNAIIACLLAQNTPDDLKMIMVDPKRVELTGYNGIPHLVSPVVVDLERIVGVLKWVSREMDERYKKFSQAGARNITDFNNRIGQNDPKLPYLVVVIDELADLMMLAPEETEKVLTRLAQMARATGIHLIVSTQRPSVDVVTGLIKANFPARISFAVASSVDSRVILDQPGAEKLLGRGDMLYQAPDAAAPLRMQGVFVSDAEINRITRFWKDASTGKVSTPVDLSDKPDPVQSRSERLGLTPSQPSTSAAPAQKAPWDAAMTPASPAKPISAVPAMPATGGASEDDEMYDAAVDLVKRMDNKASISLLQRRLRVGYTRAARLIELMKQRGVIVDTSADPSDSEDEPEEANDQ